MSDLAEYARQASLVVVTDEMSVAELSSALGVQPDQAREIGSVRPDSPVRVAARETSWELFERADSSGDISALLDRLFQRALPLREALVGLSAAGCVIKLNIVQWITPFDAVGPGISFEASVVEFLAAMRADIDVDQYVEFE